MTEQMFLNEICRLFTDVDIERLEVVDKIVYFSKSDLSTEAKQQIAIEALQCFQFYPAPIRDICFMYFEQYKDENNFILICNDLYTEKTLTAEKVL